MLQFLMQSRKTRLKVMGLFDDLVKLEADGQLILVAGKGRDTGDVDQATPDTDDEHDWKIQASCVNSKRVHDVSANVTA